MNLDEPIGALGNYPAAYVLRGSDGSYLYKGACRNLAKRLRDHRAGRVSCTKNRRPLTLVYREECSDYSAALKREKFLKSGQGRKWLNDYLKQS